MMKLGQYYLQSVLRSFIAFAMIFSIMLCRYPINVRAELIDRNVNLSVADASSKVTLSREFSDGYTPTTGTNSYVFDLSETCLGQVKSGTTYQLKLSFDCVSFVTTSGPYSGGSVANFEPENSLILKYIDDTGEHTVATKGLIDSITKYIYNINAVGPITKLYYETKFARAFKSSVQGQTAKTTFSVTMKNVSLTGAWQEEVETPPTPETPPSTEVPSDEYMTLIDTRHTSVSATARQEVVNKSYENFNLSVSSNTPSNIPHEDDKLYCYKVSYNCNYQYSGTANIYASSKSASSILTFDGENYACSTGTKNFTLYKRGGVSTIGGIFESSGSHKSSNGNQQYTQVNFTIQLTINTYLVNENSSDDIIQNIYNTVQNNQTTLEENKALQQQENVINQSIFDKISEFFGSFFQNLVGLFVPEDDYFNEYFTRLNDFFSEKLGMLYAPIDMFIGILNAIKDSSGSDTGIQFPGLKWEDTYIIQPQTISLSSIANDFPGIQEKIYFATDVIMVGAVVWLLQVKLKEVLTT